MTQTLGGDRDGRELGGPTSVAPALIAPTYVGIDPDGLRRLADIADQYAQRLSLAGTATAPLLDRVPAFREALSQNLGAIRNSLDERGDELRWRADVIAIAQSVDPAAPGPLHLDRWLVGFAAFGVLPLPTRQEQFAAWAGVRWLRALRSAPPGEVAEAFAAIGRAQARQLVADHPRAIGSLDGAPPALRFAANRVLIAAEIARLEGIADKLEPQAATQAPTRAVLRHLRARSAEYRRWLAEERQILLFDPTGDGRVVEVFGDLSAATVVGVLVPGMANDITNFSGGEGGFRRNAANLYAATARNGVATIAWLGYDTPDGVDAVSRAAAAAGAPYLARFLEGIAANGACRISVVAHSYGSVLTGIAAADGIEADDVVFIGSPGTTLENAEEARLRAGGRVWAALAENDPIGFGVDPLESYRWWWGIHPAIPVIGALESLCRREDLWHGVNPVAADFGALRISTEGSSGHSSYFRAGALENLAAILEGRHSSVDLAD